MAKEESKLYEEIAGVTVQGEAVFPHLNKPDTKFNADGEFSVKLALAEEDAAPLRATIDGLMQQALKDAETDIRETAKTKAGADRKVAELKLASAPYKPELDRDTEEETGRTLFNFKRMAIFRRASDGEVFKFTVDLFDAKRTALPKDVHVGFGSTIRVAYMARPFFKAAVGAGVSLRLEAVQVLELKQRGSKSASSHGFDEEEGYQAPAAAFDEGGSQAGGNAEGGSAAGGAPL